MRIKPTPSGGRIIEGDTPHGRFRIETDAEGNYPAGKIEIRTPIVPEPPQDCTPCAKPREIKT